MDPNRDKWQGESVDSVLRGLLKQGRLDPQAERLAEQGIDRLKAFLGTGSASSAPAGAEVPDEAEAEIVASPREPGREMLMHTVPLDDGTRVEVLVPVRLTRREADRIAGVLTALSVEDREAGQE